MISSFMTLLMIMQMKKISQLFQKLMRMLYLIPPSKEIVITFMKIILFLTDPKFKTTFILY